MNNNKNEELEEYKQLVLELVGKLQFRAIELEWKSRKNVDISKDLSKKLDDTLDKVVSEQLEKKINQDEVIGYNGYKL